MDFQKCATIASFLLVRKSWNRLLFLTFCCLFKSQIISISSKKRTKEFDYYYDTSSRLVFVCFSEEIEDTKKPFRNYLTFKKQFYLRFTKWKHSCIVKRFVCHHYITGVNISIYPGNFDPELFKIFGRSRKVFSKFHRKY